MFVLETAFVADDTVGGCLCDVLACDVQVCHTFQDHRDLAEVVDDVEAELDDLRRETVFCFCY